MTRTYKGFVIKPHLQWRLRDAEIETVEKALLFIHEQAIRCAVNLIFGEVR